MSKYHKNTIPHITEVSLRVRDLQKTSTFYQEVIGLQKLEEDVNYIILGSLGVPRISLFKTTTNNNTHNSEGLYHIAFLLPSMPSLSRWLHYNIKRGTPIYGASDHKVSSALYFTDPEGNGIEVYADTEESTWPVEDNEIKMVTLPLDVESLLALDNGTWNPTKEDIQIGHVHLRAKNINKMKEFYQELGMNMTFDFGSAKFLSYNGYHHHLGINQWGMNSASPYEKNQPGVQSMTMYYPADEYKKLSLKSIKLDDLDTLKRKPTAILNDPIGIRIYIENTL